MQKLFSIIGVALVLSACTSPKQVTNNAPLDMQTVNAYQVKVNSGNTVSAKYKVVDPKPTDNVLDASDSVPKMKVYYERRRPSVIVEPSFGYYRGWH
ncbi:lipoprotein [Aggregatibacter aphrophilus]|jgi:putative lipoprotein|uniref:Lipoprotein n=2 Tax=Aggregatibacter aphrophilus TaxID=732 RepID=A0A336N6P8_AGGAP|nr:lipoprotein [Aggregatibacter aphrophilus]KNE85853.1 lipoprotein [Aggregatibacter aphrophilus ATCC 33389]OBY53095.1 hypothetical protein BBB51_07295 [Aggregatibacter aphrophilus]RDE88507.1 hypothetical protein DPW00_03915 [Aggregatibacter aphrophilus]RDE92138.1 hypothetical protein DPW01_05135 [Aggregatibacter aphrophilus]SQI92043.1 Uncharacterised protein [Aggregatibacter aphrophilus]